jgi:hypothetical protein
VWCRSGCRESELLDAVSDLIAIDAKQLRRLRLVAASAFERLCQELSFYVLEVDALRRKLKLQGRHGSRQRREVMPLEPFALHQQHCTLDGVAQFANVPGPRAVLQHLRRGWRHAAYALAELAIGTISSGTSP